MFDTHTNILPNICERHLQLYLSCAISRRRSNADPKVPPSGARKELNEGKRAAFSPAWRLCSPLQDTSAHMIHSSSRIAVPPVELPESNPPRCQMRPITSPHQSIVPSDWTNIKLIDSEQGFGRRKVINPSRLLWATLISCHCAPGR